MRTLADLNKGESALVLAVENNNANMSKLCLRLLEIGFTPGQSVEMLEKSFFKDPVSVSLRGTIISLRVSEAECIKI
jgi:Fe2+ transport system protein FeoA